MRETVAGQTAYAPYVLEPVAPVSQVPGIIGVRGPSSNSSTTSALNPAGAAAVFVGTVPANPIVGAGRSEAVVAGSGSRSMYS